MGNEIRDLKRAAGTMCVLALALCSFNCINKPLSPIAPTWESQITVPVSVKSYTLADLLAKDSSFIANTPGGTQLVHGASFQTVPQFGRSRTWLGAHSPVAFPLTVSATGGLFADTVSIGDTSGSAQGHTLVDQKTAADFNSITLHVVTDNGIPLQVALKLKFLDMTERLLINIPQTTGDSITVPAPAVLGGIVQSPSHTETLIELTGSEVQQFNSAYSLAHFLKVSAPGTDILELEQTQTIQITVWAEFSYQVNK